MRILVISNDKSLASLIVHGLHSSMPAGTMFSACDVRSGRDRLRMENPSAVLVDVNSMHEGDAPEYVKALAPRYSVPIIAFYKGSTSVAALIQAGALDAIGWQAAEKGEERLIARLSASIMNSVNRVRVQTPEKTNPDTDKVIVIGGSTGSTQALPVVLKGLPADCPPVVCTLHMPEGYTKIYAEQLDLSLGQTVVEAKSGLYLKKGLVVIAAGGKHLRLFRDKNGYFVNSEAGVKVNGHCPSVDVLFDSAAYAAKRSAIGVILTGMGSDGAKGMLDMKRMGAYNIAEDESTAVVYGMPKVAAENGAADISLPLDKIAGHIMNRLKQGK